MPSPQELLQLVHHPLRELDLARTRGRAARVADRSGRDTAREGPLVHVAHDVGVGDDDRLASNAAARVDDGPDADLGPVLEHDARKAVLEAFEH